MSNVHGEDYRVRKQMEKLREQRLSKRLREARGEVSGAEDEGGQRLSMREIRDQRENEGCRG
jgi:hypothetical protein